MYKIYGNNPNVMVKLTQTHADQLYAIAEEHEIDPSDVMVQAFRLWETMMDRNPTEVVKVLTSVRSIVK